MQGCQRVSNGHANPYRRPSGLTAKVAQAAHGLANHAETGLVLVRAGLAVARYTQHDQTGVDGFQVFPAQPPFFQGAGAEVLDQNVTFFYQCAHHVLTLRLSQVQGQRLLVTGLHLPPDRVTVMQQTPFTQGVTAFGGFDLDDVRAKFAQDLGGKGAGDQLAQFQDPDAA